jgi:hypothetical protein
MDELRATHLGAPAVLKTPSVTERLQGAFLKAQAQEIEG